MSVSRQNSVRPVGVKPVGDELRLGATMALDCQKFQKFVAFPQVATPLSTSDVSSPHSGCSYARVVCSIVETSRKPSEGESTCTVGRKDGAQFAHSSYLQCQSRIFHVIRIFGRNNGGMPSLPIGACTEFVP